MVIEPIFYLCWQLPKNDQDLQSVFVAEAVAFASSGPPAKGSKRAPPKNRDGLPTVAPKKKARAQAPAAEAPAAEAPAAGGRANFDYLGPGSALG